VPLISTADESDVAGNCAEALAEGKQNNSSSMDDCMLCKSKTPLPEGDTHGEGAPCLEPQMSRACSYFSHPGRRLEAVVKIATTRKVDDGSVGNVAKTPPSRLHNIRYGVVLPDGHA
jgi:hypothetical protein